MREGGDQVLAPFVKQSFYRKKCLYDDYVAQIMRPWNVCIIF